VNIDIAVCLPQESGSVALVRAVIGDTLGRFGVTEECIDDIRLAISEACTNVLDHAADDDEYEVHLHVDGERCEIRVKNAGNGFDGEALAGEMPSTTSARGRGVAIMRAVMDQVRFSSEPEAGTVVHLVKRIDLDPRGALAQLRRRHA